jgi:two-component system response regulator HydG
MGVIFLASYKGIDRRHILRRNIVHKILVCDDDRSFCILLNKWLKRMEYVATTVHSCETCLKVIESDFFKIILLDNVFPDGRGVDLIARIRNISPATKIIILTGYGVMEDKLLALNYGAGYIEKPIDFQSLMTKLKQVLAE